MAQSRQHSPAAPPSPRCLSLTTHLEAPWTQQSTPLKLMPKPSPFLKNNCCSHCSAQGHLECSYSKSKFPLAGSSWKEVGALKLSHSSDQRKQSNTGIQHLSRLQNGYSILEAGSWGQWARVQAFWAGSGQQSHSICTFEEERWVWGHVLIRIQPRKLKMWMGLWMSVICCPTPISYRPDSLETRVCSTIGNSGTSWPGTHGKLFLSLYTHHGWNSSFFLDYF